MATPAAVLHGREAPLQALRAGLDAALAGHGHLALVSGEAGIGKSAFVAVVAREAAARGAVVTWGRAWEFADAPPYFPVRPCLRALGIGGDGDAHAHDESHAFQLWESVVASLARTSSSAPAVWILEDLHAADLGTLDLLTFLADSLRSMRVLVVATVRAKDPRLTDRMQRRLTRMARDGLDVRLEPLSERDIARLADETIGEPLSAAGVKQLAEHTRGNPLFVVECARAFRAGGRVEVALRSLSPTVRQVVLDRVELLPDATRDALACGAILGREFSAALVARMCKSLPARVIDTLLPALRAGLIDELRPGQFVFSHVVTRDAIDDALGGEQRATLHAQAGAALASLGDTADVLVERARHALAALRPEDEASTLAIVERATTLLEREGALDRAFELHARTSEARAAGYLPPATNDAKLRMAEIAHAAGHSDACRRICEEVVASARAAENPELLARAALLCASHVQIGFVDRTIVALLEEAHAAVAERSPTLACRVLARLATALIPAADPSGPIQMARDAVRGARETNEDAVVLEVLDTAGWALGYAPAEERIGLSTELRDRALRASDLPRAVTAYSRLALDHMETGDFEAFERDTETLLEISDEIGHPRHRWRALLLASTRATTHGQFAESDRFLTEATELAALNDDPGVTLSLALHALLRARIRRTDDETGALLGRLEAAMRDAPHAPLMLACTRASVAARMEDVEATKAGLAVMGSRAAILLADRSFAAYLAEAYALAGTDEERRAVREILANGANDLVGGEAPFTYEGTTARLLGLLDASLGDLRGAETQLRSARSLALARNHAPWAAQTAYELAKVLHRAGKDAEARALVEESATSARRIGMPGLEKSVGGGISAAEAIADTGNGPTQMEREGEIWRIRHAGRVAMVKDSRGMRLLARLVERPGDEIHVLVLASDEATAVPESSAGEVLDVRAKKAYRQRLVDLEAEIDEAERHADVGRLAKLRRERDALQAEVARAVGRSGRMRQAASATERARINVQKRVKDAIARIADCDQGLGRFFEHALCTGTFCCFRP